MKFQVLVHASCVVALLFVTGACGTAQEPTLAFRAATVVDVTDGTLRPDRTVLIQGRRIAAVGPADDVEIPAGATIVDATGRYLIPGLWDMHVHITDATELALPVLLANGVTGVRDAGGDLSLLRRLERERAAGERRSPRLAMAGPYVDSEKGGLPYRLVVETAEDGRSAADSLARADVDFIKIHNGVPREAYFAVVARAQELAIPVVGHIPLEVAPAEAARAGQAGVEHFVSLFEGPLRQRFAADPERMMREYVESGLDTLMTTFAEEEVWFTPTVHTYRLRARRGELAVDPDPRLGYVAPSLREQWDAWYPVQPRDSAPQIVAARERFYRIGLDVVTVAHEAGVRLLAGTDLAARDVLPGFHLHDELAALVDAGLTPAEALRTATLNPARFLGRADALGTIEEGNLADVVLLDADPLADIRNTRRIAAVVADGTLLDRETLDGMLRRVKRTVRERERANSGSPGRRR